MKQKWPLIRPLFIGKTYVLVPETGIEPVRPCHGRGILSPLRLPVPPLRRKMEATPGFEPGMKDLQSSALPLGYVAKKMERKTRFELATLALARRCSTTELLPRNWCRETELNCRHADFQSAALPTELPRLNGGADGTRTRGLRLDRPIC